MTRCTYTFAAAWEISTTTLPETVTIEVFNAEGVQVGGETFDLVWTQVDGGKCGGPHESQILRL
ncbi:hypothetical protein C2138_04705 [Salinibacterium hongtaonis]|nr:hypothetical protein C2138_04705 [Salinibacterium hongtaonis]